MSPQGLTQFSPQVVRQHVIIHKVFWLHVSDIGLLTFHTALVLFNCTGWIWRRTRRWHLATLAATAASWVILGFWFGSGYCLCTDLHWRVREALGDHPTEQTYIQYLVRHLTGWTPSAELASNSALGVFLVTAALSVWLNFRDWRVAKRQSTLVVPSAH